MDVAKRCPRRDKGLAYRPGLGRCPGKSPFLFGGWGGRCSPPRHLWRHRPRFGRSGNRSAEDNGVHPNAALRQWGAPGQNPGTLPPLPSFSSPDSRPLAAAFRPAMIRVRDRLSGAGLIQFRAASKCQSRNGLSQGQAPGIFCVASDFGNRPFSHVDSGNVPRRLSLVTKGPRPRPALPTRLAPPLWPGSRLGTGRKRQSR